MVRGGTVSQIRSSWLDPSAMPRLCFLTKKTSKFMVSAEGFRLPFFPLLVPMPNYMFISGCPVVNSVSKRERTAATTAKCSKPERRDTFLQVARVRLKEEMGATISRFWNPTPTNALLPAPSDAAEPPLSKNQRKKLARDLRYRALKKERKAAKKALKAKQLLKKRNERTEVLRKLPEEERMRLEVERSRIMLENRAEDRAKRTQLLEALTNGTRYHVCIDLGWNDVMTEKELKSLARQLAYCYSALRKAFERGQTPLKVSFTGLDNIIKPMMTVVSSNWETWPLPMSEEPLEKVYDKSRLVYLTHDSENLLEALDPQDIYVIGGIVDRGRLKCATFNKAKSLGIRTARLNLDTNISLEHGTKVLTVNHCVDILVHAANGMSWKESYLTVLPVRKGITSASRDNAPN